MAAKPEVLSPAGDRERLDMALGYGADAVYLAGNAFGMRAFAGNFDREGLRGAVEAAHAKGARVHVTCNTLARNNEAARLPEYLEYLDAIGVDAVIAAGPDVLDLCRRHAPPRSNPHVHPDGHHQLRDGPGVARAGGQPGDSGPGAVPGRGG